MFWSKYPYTDAHELNLDWILHKIWEMDKSLSEFEALNKITFDGEWNITKQYPAWCIVNTNGGTEGYISIKPVPAGVVITNTDYWVSVVNYTATIADLQNRVVALEGRVDALDEEVNRPRRFIFIGDSYDRIIPNLSWSGIVISELGLQDSLVSSNGGHGFISTVGTWLSDIQNLTVDDDSTITDILILGGANDIFETLSDLPDAMSAFDTYVRGRFTNLKNIYVGFAGNSFYNVAQAQHMRAGFRYYMDGAKTLNWIYLNGIECTLFNPAFVQVIGTNDYLHPNSDGVQALGENVVACINSGSCNNIHAKRAFSITLNTTAFNAGTFSIDEAINNNLLTFRTGDIGLTAAATLTGQIKIGTCQDLENALEPNTFIPVIAFTNAGDVFPSVLFFTDYKTLEFLVPSNHPVNSGTYVVLRATNAMVDMYYTAV